MRIRLKWLLDFLVSAPADGHVLTYEAATQRWKNKVLPNSMKIWRGATTCNANGLWSVNFSSAGFTSAPFVSATARNINNDRDNRNFGGVTTVSNTGATGTSCRSTSSSLLGIGTTLNNSPSGTVIDVVAIGT